MLLSELCKELEMMARAVCESGNVENLDLGLAQDLLLKIDAEWQRVQVAFEQEISSFAVQSKSLN